MQSDRRVHSHVSTWRCPRSGLDFISVLEFISLLQTVRRIDLPSTRSADRLTETHDVVEKFRCEDKAPVLRPLSSPQIRADREERDRENGAKMRRASPDA
jgi:hypothetical protein